MNEEICGMKKENVFVRSLLSFDMEFRMKCAAAQWSLYMIEDHKKKKLLYIFPYFPFEFWYHIVPMIFLHWNEKLFLLSLLLRSMIVEKGPEKRETFKFFK